MVAVYEYILHSLWIHIVFVSGLMDVYFWLQVLWIHIVLFQVLWMNSLWLQAGPIHAYLWLYMDVYFMVA